MIFHIKTIHHKEQDHNTVGNYWIDENGVLQIRVSEMNNEDYEFLVAIHELLEAYLSKREGIEYDKITEFDKRFENMRRDYPELVQDMEPGASDVAPYHKQHKLASMFAKWIADNMQVDWDAYSEAVKKL